MAYHNPHITGYSIIPFLYMQITRVLVTDQSNQLQKFLLFNFESSPYSGVQLFSNRFGATRSKLFKGYPGYTRFRAPFEILVGQRSWLSPWQHGPSKRTIRLGD